MASTNNQCAACSKPGKLCAGCNNIHYCSAACQKTGWKVHKLVCSTFKESRHPPGPMWMRVIAFPVNSTKPEFRWMPIRKGHIQRPLVGDYFGADKPYFEYPSFSQDPKTDKQLPLRITVQDRDSFLTDGSWPNKSVHHLTNGHLFQEFRGPILVYGNALEGNDIKIKHVNLDTTHLNLIRDYCKLGPYISEHEPLWRQRLEEDLKMFPPGPLPNDFVLWSKYQERVNREPDLGVTEEDVGTPEFKRSYDRTSIYKQKWAEVKQAQEVANGTRLPKDFHHPLSKENAWRSEMRLSGRHLGVDFMDVGSIEKMIIGNGK